MASEDLGFFFCRKKNRRVAHKCYDTEQYVEDAGWNVCYEKLLRIVKTDTCKAEAGCLSFVHGLHNRKKLSGPQTIKQDEAFIKS